jgi:Pentapeptide repeats (9 copies)
VDEGEKRVLKPANENPWYVLMTLYGEQDGEEIDWELHEKNRAAWNAWACQGMSEEERANAAASSKVTVEELSAWPTLHADVKRRHKAEMLRRNTKEFAYPGLPNVIFRVDLSETIFFKRLVLTKGVLRGVDFESATFRMGARFVSVTFIGNARFATATFVRDASFDSATFRGDASFHFCTYHGSTSFRFATFSGTASFRAATFNRDAGFGGATFRRHAGFFGATFSGEARFGSSTFNADAVFRVVTFDGYAGFDSTTFSREAGFDSATFNNNAWFGGATFSGDAGFGSATFRWNAGFNSSAFSSFAYFPEAKFGKLGEDREVSFVDCQFQKPTNFRDAIFHSRHPDFSSAILHDKTTFTDKPDNWPSGPQSDPAQAKASCAVIRHTLGKQGLPEAEHFFFRREMGFAGQSGPLWQRPPYWLFGWISDYGYSILTPFLWLCLLIVGGGFGLSWGLAGSATPVGFTQSLGLSLANVFNFLSFHKTFATEAFMGGLSPSLKALSGFQSIAGVVLLFFLGLGLRTRFRMR